MTIIASDLLTNLWFTFPNINPIIFEIGPVAIRWYSLAYIVGIYLGGYYMRYLDKDTSIPHKFFDMLIIWSIIGIVVGGRIGYVLFYESFSELLNPLHVLNTLNGGMSFHGGFIGLVFTIAIFCKYQKLKTLVLFDLIACAAPIGLFFGRIANFINGELYGRATEVKWGIIFPMGGPLPRHPSQIYEALSEGLLSFLVLLLLYRLTKAKDYPGTLTAAFLLLYSCSRIIIEQFREPDAALGFVYSFLTMGQLLSLPMFVTALVLFYVNIRRI
jgi:phosphatidylglycerol:prolipoprotein diacylglycerol transferase